ncbi:DNA polymerase III subunit gamma/tau [Thermosulfidibacter takaii ABI70S6]|uniref:DNA polymerase III subunit gamma/tau n=1 Tax=Thermosulfidibacter takaii (strain DSM 17441 / JCM 13301 / NBRC 103674 / ABI70S6) TaxID=1298851 RepID=A0A0S3QS99_THET7|nr:DNA polymerase III subunit gamma/tau [Thermosulfidibacter takaii]BAT71188.1 DNA polymerase III subunit gamma/tau [Thermosulfidibacter takaii ABI70S6]
MYQVIARRWRPKSFDDVVGQRHVVETLKRAVEKGRILHAYLFAGPRGVGKTSMARIFAKALNCEKGPTSSPCCKCEACVEIDKGAFVDVVEMDAASNRGIDEIRELRERVRYASVKGRYKVFIIDEVHMLTDQAFNALLKTLEEPPPGVVFVFATTEPRRIPQTILSRCVRFDFKPLTQQEAVEILARICEKENVKFEQDALEVIAKAAGGSLRDAEMLLEQAILFTDGNVMREKVYDILGLVDILAVESFVKALLDRDTEAALKVFRREVLGKGYDLGGFLFSLLDYLRDRLAQEALRGNTELSVKFYTFFKVFLGVAEEIRRHPWGDLLMEAEIIRLTSLPPLESVVSLLNEGQVIGQVRSIQTVVDKEVETPSPQKGPKNTESITDVMKSKISDVVPYLSFLVDSAKISVDDNKVVIESGNLRAVEWEMLLEKREVIEKALAEHGYKVVFQGYPENSNGKKERLNLREKARENPVVQKVLELFPEGVIIDVKRREN